LGYRVRANKLGDVYRYEDIGDLRARAEALWRKDLRQFAEPAAAFWQRFTDEAIRTFFTARLLQAEPAWRAGAAPRRSATVSAR
jgi:hypothetical protein